MNRRTFLGSIGSVSSLGALWYASRDPVDRIDVRFWTSETAASYDLDPDRIRDYLAFAFDLEFWSVRVTYGGEVSISTEDGYAVTTRGEWPAKLAEGAAGGGSVRPVGDVNLLVTDGQMESGPTGAGLPHVASVGGARYLTDLPPLEERPGIVPYTTHDRVMQIVIHEAGHALGLDHEHGVAYREDDAVVATPMLSAYAWDREYGGDRSVCGHRYPPTGARERRLTFSFSSCATARLRSYTGGFTP